MTWKSYETQVADKEGVFYPNSGKSKKLGRIAASRPSRKVFLWGSGTKVVPFLKAAKRKLYCLREERLTKLNTT